MASAWLPTRWTTIGGGADLIGPISNPANQWHHVDATCDGTNRVVYLDGNIVGHDTPGSHSVPSVSNLRQNRLRGIL
jgi:hypothetical protein